MFTPLAQIMCSPLFSLRRLKEGGMGLANEIMAKLLQSG